MRKMADFQVFGFVVAFISTVEGSVTSRASSLYSSGRKRVPQTLDSALGVVEKFVSSYYSPARDWVEEKGTAGLQKADELVWGWAMWECSGLGNFCWGLAGTLDPCSCVA